MAIMATSITATMATIITTTATILTIIRCIAGGIRTMAGTTADIIAGTTADTTADTTDIKPADCSRTGSDCRSRSQPASPKQYPAVIDHRVAAGCCFFLASFLP